MAQTLSNGVVVPDGDGDEQISATGVTEMRTLGASADAQLGDRYTKAQADALLAGKSPTTHAHDGRYYTQNEADQLINDATDTTGLRSLYLAARGA